MLKLIFSITCCVFILNASTSVDKKISTKKTELYKSKKTKVKTSLQLKILAKQINIQISELKNIKKDIDLVNNDISKHTKMLLITKNKLLYLKKSSSRLIKRKENFENELINIIIEDFSSSIAIELASEDSISELIDSEIYSLLSTNTKDSLLKINNRYLNLNINTKFNEENLTKLNIYIKKRKEKRNILNGLKKQHTRSLKSLAIKHLAYKKALKSTILKQKSIQYLLRKLNIVKKKERKKERLSKSKSKYLKKIYSTNAKYKDKALSAIDLDVRILGSSIKGIKISKYKGRKTIAPLKSFTIVKRFGTYYDPVYKIKLFNESLIIKSKRRNSKVYSILKGKIVYAKKNSGILDNVVIVQHKGGLHTIYSHLDKIPPTLRVGKWIQKGYVVGRVNDTLTFQATKNSAHVNPQDLFN